MIISDWIQDNHHPTSIPLYESKDRGVHDTSHPSKSRWSQKCQARRGGSMNASLNSKEAFILPSEGNITSSTWSSFLLFPSLNCLVQHLYTYIQEVKSCALPHSVFPISTLLSLYPNHTLLIHSYPIHHGHSLYLPHCPCCLVACCACAYGTLASFFIRVQFWWSGRNAFVWEVLWSMGEWFPTPTQETCWWLMDWLL